MTFLTARNRHSHVFGRSAMAQLLTLHHDAIVSVTCEHIKQWIHLLFLNLSPYIYTQLCLPFRQQDGSQSRLWYHRAHRAYFGPR